MAQTLKTEGQWNTQSIQFKTYQTTQEKLTGYQNKPEFKFRQN